MFSGVQSSTPSFDTFHEPGPIKAMSSSPSPSKSATTRPAIVAVSAERNGFQMCSPCAKTAIH